MPHLHSLPLSKVKLTLQLLDMRPFGSQAGRELTYVVLLLMKPHLQVLQLGLRGVQVGTCFTLLKNLPVQCSSSTLDNY